MADESAGAIARQLRTLWNAGAIGEADDAALLARFSARRDETAEAAFRVLVERHGPMVLRVCRQVLGDGHDAHDAAQAVFLVLARKSGSIRSRGSVAPWLHGVASRVAAKARRRAAVRRTNETRVTAIRGHPVAGPDRTSLDWEALHEEVDRLPEKYRAPVVLCYLEGQTYEATARRLDCPVGTVRVRLSRARERLRDRLARRGIGPTALVLVVPADTPPSGWIESTVRSAQAFVSGRAAEVGAVSASVMTLSQGVLRAMMISKLKLTAFGLLATGVLAAGGNALVGQQPAPPKSTSEAIATNPFPDLVDREGELAHRVREAALKRLKAQQSFYEEGRITIDRYLEASRQVRDAETRLATRRAERVAAARSHLKRVNDIVKREKAELDEGRGTAADVAEAEQASDVAELDLFDAETSGGRHDYEALERRLAAVEQNLDRVTSLLARYGIDSPTGKAVKRSDPSPRK